MAPTAKAYAALFPDEASEPDPTAHRGHRRDIKFVSFHHIALELTLFRSTFKLSTFHVDFLHSNVV